MNNILNVVCPDPDILEDFVQATLELLERTRIDMNEDNGRDLLASFNDDEIANGIVYHFRVNLFDDEVLTKRFDLT